MVIDQTNNVLISGFDESYRLTIKECSLQDFASYTVRAVNAAGAAEATATLSEKGMSLPATRAHPCSQWRIKVLPVAASSLHVCLCGAFLSAHCVRLPCFALPCACSSPRLSATGPRIDAPLPTKMTIDQGQPIRLEILCSGAPSPTVTWLKNGREIPTDERVQTTTLEDGKSSLTIESVLPEDSGSYSATVENPLGKASSRCDLWVKRTWETRGRASTFVRFLLWRC